MQTAQYRLAPDAGAWHTVPADALPGAQLVLAFGPSRDGVGGVPGDAWFAAMAERWPDAARVYCSTAGQIAGGELVDDTVVVTAVRFAHTAVRAVVASLVDGDDGTGVGAALARQLPTDDLRHVLAFGRGVQLNGGALARGLDDALPDGVQVSGGLAGDDTRIQYTTVALGGAPTGAEGAVAVGFYGERLQVGVGAVGGWETFGPDRLVTRADREAIGSLVRELDGEPALALYRRYLGPLADELPRAGLLFPLALRTRAGDTGVVRMVMDVDEAAGGVRLAGDVPEGMYVRLMKASSERLIDAAARAADLAAVAGTRAGGPAGSASGGGDGGTLAVVVSCAGRRWVLGHRTEEELEAVRDALGPGACLAGLYSYGELAPAGGGGCELHNQTMTLTTFREP